jgi:broad specificity phosphatase PhoE
MTELLIIRHAQTEANVAGRWEGWTDPPLTPTGRAQAEAIARRLAPEAGQIAVLYTSPLRRALETAQAIGAALDLEPTPVEPLKEIHFGQLEGVSLQQMEARYPDLYARWQDKTDMAFRWPGGEQRAAFFTRAAQACQRILTRHPDDRVVIVAHGGTIRACLAHLLPRQLGGWWSYTLDNGGLTRVRVVGNEASLLMLNGVGHISEHGAP